MSETGTRKASAIRAYSNGDAIFREGDSGAEMFVVRKGRVRIFRQAGATELTLATLGPGESFGEMALIDRTERSANASAIEETELVVVGEDAFVQMVKDRPDIAVRLLKELSARLRDANRQIKLLAIHGSAARVVETLRSYLPRDAQGEVLLPHVAPDQLFKATGVAREVFGEVMHRLNEAGVARFGSDGLRISLPHDLDDYLEYLDLKRSFDPATSQELAALAHRGDDGAAAQEALFGAGVGPEPKRRVTYQRFVALKERFEK